MVGQKLQPGYTEHCQLQFQEVSSLSIDYILSSETALVLLLASEPNQKENKV